MTLPHSKSTQATSWATEHIIQTKLATDTSAKDSRAIRTTETLQNSCLNVLYSAFVLVARYPRSIERFFFTLGG